MPADLLVQISEADDEEVKQRLQHEVVVLNMGVARAIAARYRSRVLGQEDLVQVAYVGLVKAVHGIDPAYQTEFIGYAVPTVAGEVKRYFRDFGWAVRSMSSSRTCIVRRGRARWRRTWRSTWTT